MASGDLADLLVKRLLEGGHAGKAVSAALRVKVALSGEVLVKEYASHIPAGENYSVLVDLHPEGAGGEGLLAVNVWWEVRHKYGQLLREACRDSFVLALPGGTRLSPDNGVTDGDALEVCRPLPWEKGVWAEAAASLAAPSGGSLGGRNAVSLPATPARDPVKVASPSRSAKRKSKKRGLKRKEKETRASEGQLVLQPLPADLGEAAEAAQQEQDRAQEQPDPSSLETESESAPPPAETAPASLALPPAAQPAAANRGPPQPPSAKTLNKFSKIQTPQDWLRQAKSCVVKRRTGKGTMSRKARAKCMKLSVGALASTLLS